MYPRKADNQPLQEGTTPQEKSLLQKDQYLQLPQQPSPSKNTSPPSSVEAHQAGELIGVACSGLYHDVNRILNTYTNKPIHTNITKAEHITLENLRKDKDFFIVTADRGVAQIVMDNTESITKVKPPTRQLSLSASLQKHISNYPQRTC